MNTRRLLATILLASALSIAGCDISFEPFPAYADIDRPRPQQTLEMGEPFRVSARIEAESPVDSLVAEVRPIAPNSAPVRIRIAVPSALRSGSGILKADVDTSLVLPPVDMVEAKEYRFTIVAYLHSGRQGSSDGVPVKIAPAPRD